MGGTGSRALWACFSRVWAGRWGECRRADRVTVCTLSSKVIENGSQLASFSWAWAWVREVTAWVRSWWDTSLGYAENSSA